jgi:hypothetical protein
VPYMKNSSKNFYLFIGFHSFLLGLFPFFLPVYLFKNGAGLDEISWFIAITGITFTLTLFALDYLRGKSYLVPLLISFALEMCLLALLVFGAPLWLVGVVNGAYNCLYWMLQRILFLSGGTEENSGKRFGNFQIYILIVLKMGIFCGSLLLENVGIALVCMLSVAIACIAGFLFLRQRVHLTFPEALVLQPPVSVRELFKYKDNYRSRQVFIFDGVFLYLESYFWVISLFLMVGESFVKLGGLVILLAVILGMIFYVIKNQIDNIDKQIVYRIGVVLYTCSWGLRVFFNAEASYVVQIIMILIIAFCTSFFRLTFNKRFFDLAKRSGENRYLFVKSHYSQFFIAIAFVIIGCCVGSFGDNVGILQTVYFIAAGFSILYLLYRSENSVG